MANALSVFAVIMAVACVTVFIFAGIYGSSYTGKITDIHQDIIEKTFSVEYSVIEDYYGNPLAVVKTEEGIYLDADEFFDNFKNGGSNITAYEVEDGKAVNQSTLIITFTGPGSKLTELSNMLPKIINNAQAD